MGPGMFDGLGTGLCIAAVLIALCFFAFGYLAGALIHGC